MIAQSRKHCSHHHRHHHRHHHQTNEDPTFKQVNRCQKVVVRRVIAANADEAWQSTILTMMMIDDSDDDNPHSDDDLFLIMT